jgi:hypothetical protein
MGQCRLMRPSRRMLALTLGSAVYWIVALGVIALAGAALPGDCWTERTRTGFDQCISEGRTVGIAGFALAALVYGVAIWRVRRRR